MDRIEHGAGPHTLGTGAPADASASGAAIEAEFDVCTARLGIEVPADLKGGVLRGYRGLREMATLLRDVPTRRDDGKETPNG